MFIVGHFINAVALVIYYVLNFYIWVIIARAILSWVNPDPYNPIVRFIHSITEPLLYQIRKKIPVNFSGIDFSPLIVILAIVFLQEFLVGSLRRVAAVMM